MAPFQKHFIIFATDFALPQTTCPISQAPKSDILVAASSFSCFVLAWTPLRSLNDRGLILEGDKKLHFFHRPKPKEKNFSKQNSQSSFDMRNSGRSAIGMIAL